MKNKKEEFCLTAVFLSPDLNSRVHVIVDVIVFQHTVAIVIEVDPNLQDSEKYQLSFIHM